MLIATLYPQGIREAQRNLFTTKTIEQEKTETTEKRSERLVA
jgi:hypothetical protein